MEDAAEPAGNDTGTKRIRDQDLHQETKRQRREDPVLVYTVERREPPRNFLEVALRQKLEGKPNFTSENLPGNAGNKLEKDVQQPLTRTPVRKKVLRLEEKIKYLQETPGRKRKRGTGVQSTELSPLLRQSRVTAY